MKKQNVIKFTWGSLPVDALNRQTMHELRLIASRQGTTIEQVMSKALQWFLATPEAGARQTHGN
jgi:hypothetical protein